MNRRTAVKYIAGATVSSLVLPAFLSGCQTLRQGGSYKQLFLSADEYAFLKSLADTLIPKTETPGALQLGVPEWLDTAAATCYEKNQQEKFRSQLKLVSQNLSANGVFHQLPAADRLKTLQTLEASLKPKSELHAAYTALKRSIGAAYQETEFVGMNLFKYDRVPGEYQPCIPISTTNKKAWTYG